MLEFEKGNRQDLVDQNKAEIEILLNYLPQQLSEEEIKKIVEDSAIELGASSIKDMGKVMSMVSPKVKGCFDMGVVSSKIKSRLS